MPDVDADLLAHIHEGGGSPTPPPKPRWFRRRGLTVVAIASAAILGVGLRIAPAVLEARRAALSAQYRNSLRSIHFLLGTYESARERLPPRDNVDSAGRPLSSWRVSIDAFTGDFGDSTTEDSSDSEGDHYRSRYDLGAAWNAPSNRDAASDHWMFCWDDPRTLTSVFAVTGPDTAFDDRPHRRGLPHEPGDLPPDLIVLMEVADSNTHWAQPGDYKVTDLLAYRGRLGDHLHGLLPDRLHVLFADGEVWALDADAPIADLQPFLTITGAKTHDRDQLLGPHKVD
jgi:hypothetical protein